MVAPVQAWRTAYEGAAASSSSQGSTSTTIAKSNVTATKAIIAKTAPETQPPTVSIGISSS